MGEVSTNLRNVYERFIGLSTPDETLSRKLIHLVLDHAKRIIAHPSRQTLSKVETFTRYPFAELDLERSIDESPMMDDPDNFLVEFPEPKPFSCLTLLDCSASMAGDKHLAASVAVAVMLLQIPPPNTGLVIFSSNAKTIKSFSNLERIEHTILRFLKTRPKGFTNIAKALEVGFKQMSLVKNRRRNIALIATDGRTTEGLDPIEFARSYDYLSVLHLHGPGSYLQGSKDLALAGHGICLEVNQFEELPRRMYEAIRRLGREA